MTDARAAVGMDRLPWLSDEPRPSRQERGGRDLLGWGVAAMLFIAGASYWLGTQTAPSGVEEPAPPRSRNEPAATVKLPEPRTVTVTPEVPIAETPQVRPVPVPPAPIVAVPEPKAEKPVRRKRAAPAVRRKKLSPMDVDDSKLRRTVARQSASPSRAAAAAPPRAAAGAQPLRLWPARETRGAYGRVVRIGAFGSRQQAKLGWRRMQRAYPAVGRLPAVVVTDRNSRGRTFYRFQIGTTSQAHSEVLCQRMQRIRFSCAVVGLPWKAKVER